MKFLSCLSLMLILSGCKMGHHSSISNVETSHEEKTDVLIRAIKNGDIKKVLKFIHNDNVNVPIRGSTTPLMLASFYGYESLVDVLLNLGAEVNRLGDTPLIFASTNGHTKIVNKLIQKGANVDAQNKKGTTALKVASLAGYIEIVKFLLENGADVNAKNNRGETALMSASRAHHENIIKLLLQYNAMPNEQNIDGETALDYVNKEEYPAVRKSAIVKLLRSHGAQYGYEIKTSLKSEKQTLDYRS